MSAPRQRWLRAVAWRVILRARGFSLLEVMVSVAILGLALTVILSAQGGLSTGNRTAENQGVAASLGRCKMTELEERLAKLGYPLTDEIETDKPCCGDAINAKFTCDFKIEKIELPQPESNANAGDGGLNLSAMVGAGLGSSAGGITGASLDMDGGVQGASASMMNQLDSMGGAGGMLDMVMAMVYPTLKPMMEQGIRRVSVTVRWKEGVHERELPLVQFIADPARAGFVGGLSSGMPDFSGLSSGGATGASGGAATQGTTGTTGAGSSSPLQQIGGTR